MARARKRPWKAFDPAKGPWLIWSYHWNCWHMSSSTGSAAGYTNDIAQAGLFDERTARAYHDPPPHRRDEAVPARKAIKELHGRLGALTAARDAFAAKVASVEAALAPAKKDLSGPQRSEAALSGDET